MDSKLPPLDDEYRSAWRALSREELQYLLDDALTRLEKAEELLSYGYMASTVADDMFADLVRREVITKGEPKKAYIQWQQETKAFLEAEQ